MGTKYLIDSNVVIDFLAGRLPANGDALVSQCFNAIPEISVIVKIELLSHNEEEALLNKFIERAFIHALTEEIVDRTILIRKSRKIKTPDAIIAATALVFDYTLLSRNEIDFVGIPKLKLVNPHKL